MNEHILRNGQEDDDGEDGAFWDGYWRELNLSYVRGRGNQPITRPYCRSHVESTRVIESLSEGTPMLMYQKQWWDPVEEDWVDDEGKQEQRERVLAQATAQKRLQEIMSALHLIDSSRFGAGDQHEAAEAEHEVGGVGGCPHDDKYEWKQPLIQRRGRVSKGAEKRERGLKLVSLSERNKEYDCSLDSNPEGLLIGRSRKNGIVLHDLSVSKSHAHVVQVANYGCCVQDVGSKHGTTVNGLRLSSALETSEFWPLFSGDILLIGEVKFAVESSGGEAQRQGPVVSSRGTVNEKYAPSFPSFSFHPFLLSFSFPSFSSFILLPSPFPSFLHHRVYPRYRYPTLPFNLISVL
jgi:hypothetical protein